MEEKIKKTKVIGVGLENSVIISNEKEVYMIEHDKMNLSKLNFKVPIIQVQYVGEKYYLLDYYGYVWKETYLLNDPTMLMKEIFANHENLFSIGVDLSIYIYEYGGYRLNPIPDKNNILTNTKLKLISKNYFLCENNENNNQELFQYKNYCPIESIKMDINSKIISIACGENHCLFLNESQKVFTLGSNITGQLGLGVDCARYINKLTYNEKLFFIESISCSINSSYCIDVNGIIYVFGNYNSTVYFSPEKLDFLPCADFICTQVRASRPFVQDKEGNVWTIDFSSSDASMKKKLIKLDDEITKISSNRDLNSFYTIITDEINQFHAEKVFYFLLFFL